MIQEIFEAEIEDTEKSLEKLNISASEAENFEYSDTVERFTEEIERAIEEAYKGDCQKVIDYLIARTSRIDFVDQRAFKTSLALTTLFKGDFERFVNYGQGIKVNRVIARIPKDQDKFIRYLTENGDYDLAGDLEYELFTWALSNLYDLFPLFEKGHSEQLIDIIHGYTVLIRKVQNWRNFW